MMSQERRQIKTFLLSLSQLVSWYVVAEMKTSDLVVCEVVTGTCCHHESRKFSDSSPLKLKIITFQKLFNSKIFPVLLDQFIWKTFLWRQIYFKVIASLLPPTLVFIVSIEHFMVVWDYQPSTSTKTILQFLSWLSTSYSSLRVVEASFRLLRSLCLRCSHHVLSSQSIYKNSAIKCLLKLRRT